MNQQQFPDVHDEAIADGVFGQHYDNFRAWLAMVDTRAHDPKTKRKRR